MKSQLKSIFAPLLEANKYDRLKLLLLSGCYAMIIGSYSILKPIKNPVFFNIVGKEWQPFSRFFSIPFLILGILIYSKLVDRLRRYQVLIFFLSFYAITNLIFAYILQHPVYGLHNTNLSCWRFLGWTFYFYLDLYHGFVLSAFWAFTHSINSPEAAKKSYGIMVAFSKIGGIATPLLAAAWLRGHSNYLSISILITVTTFLLSAAILMILQIKRKVPGYLLHGYEAAYQLEKERGKIAQKVEKKEKELLERKEINYSQYFFNKIKSNFNSVFGGIKLMIMEPYVFGIFLTVFSYEAISAMLDYQMNIMISVAKQNNVVSMSSFILYYTATFQGLGLILALFGTAFLLKHLDVKICLLVMPIATILLAGGLMLFPSLTTIFIVMVILRALQYGFNYPTREILYIPTVKDIKFKSKAWIDSFGRGFSKLSGSTCNIFFQTTGSFNVTLILSSMWIFVAMLVGKKYTQTVAANEVIGMKALKTSDKAKTNTMSPASAEK